jgi:hypothetical protein
MHGHETPTQGPWQFWSIAERQSAPPSVCRGAYALSRLPLEPWPRGPGPELADPAAAKTRLPDSHWEGSSFLRPAGRAAPPSSARTAGPLPPLPPGRPGRSPLLRPDGRAAAPSSTRPAGPLLPSPASRPGRSARPAEPLLLFPESSARPAGPLLPPLPLPGHGRGRAGPPLGRATACPPNRRAHRRQARPRAAPIPPKPRQAPALSRTASMMCPASRCPRYHLRPSTADYVARRTPLADTLTTFLNSPHDALPSSTFPQPSCSDFSFAE